MVVNCFGIVGYATDPFPTAPLMALAIPLAYNPTHGRRRKRRAKVAERLTRAQATRTAESVLEYEGTRKGRKCYASRFARDVFKAIAADECTDPKFCSALALRTWRRVWEGK